MDFRARDQGRRACEDGYGRCKNPYDQFGDFDETSRHRSWEDGYRAQEYDMEEERRREEERQEMQVRQRRQQEEWEQQRMWEQQQEEEEYQRQLEEDALEDGCG